MSAIVDEIRLRADASARAVPAVDWAINCIRGWPHILRAVGEISEECQRMFLVEDDCTDQTSNLVSAEYRDLPGRVLRRGRNHGVGSALNTGCCSLIAFILLLLFSSICLILMRCLVNLVGAAGPSSASSMRKGWEHQ